MCRERTWLVVVWIWKSVVAPWVVRLSGRCVGEGLGSVESPVLVRVPVLALVEVVGVASVVPLVELACEPGEPPGALALVGQVVAGAHVAGKALFVLIGTLPTHVLSGTS